MAGGGRGGPVVFPHPDDDDAGRLLDDVGSKNTNDDDPFRGCHATTTSWRAPTTDRKGTTTAVHLNNELDERWNDEM
jgi:hypothetical protein